MMLLHHAANSPHSASVRMVLAQKGLSYSSRTVDLEAFEQHETAFLAISPTGQVPVLEDQVARLLETFLILLYLDERYPEPPLGGDSAKSRYAVQKWGKYVETHIAPYLAIVRWRALNGRVPVDALDALGVLPAPRRELWQRAARGFSADEVGRAAATLARAAERVAVDLRGTSWLAGGSPTLANFAVYPHLAQFAGLGVGVPREVAAWLEQMERIPSVRADI